MKKISFALSATLLLAACANGPAPYHGNDYTALPPVRLNVSAILVDNAYLAPNTAPNVDQILSPTPAEALQQAITQHYPQLMTARNNAIEARFTITDASIVQSPLAIPQEWVQRTFSQYPESRYDGHISLEATAAGSQTRRSGFAKVDVTRSLELSSMSESARRAQLDGLVAQMVDDAIQQLDQQVGDNFGSLIYGDGSADMEITPQPSDRWEKMRNWK